MRSLDEISKRVGVFRVQNEEGVVHLPDCIALVAVSEDDRVVLLQQLFHLLHELASVVGIKNTASSLGANFCVRHRPTQVDFELNLRWLHGRELFQPMQVLPVVHVTVRDDFIEISRRPELHRAHAGGHEGNDSNESALKGRKA